MPREVGFLIFGNFQLLDAAGPISTFQIGERHSPGAYRLRVLAKREGAVPSSAGVSILAEALAAAPALDTLLVAGGEGTYEALKDPEILGFVRHAASACRRVASVCSGTFILAEAGLLDGRRATTHWSRCRQFAKRYPRVSLEPDRIFVRDGSIWSSAGITAGIDLALALVADDLGETIARQTAQQLVVYRRRPGGQTQFSALLDMERPNGRFGALLGWAREQLSEALTVEQLADKAGDEPAQLRAPLCGGDGHHAGPRHRTAQARSRTRTESRPTRRRSTPLRRRSASATRSACGAPSCAPSASRRRRCAAPPAAQTVDAGGGVGGRASRAPGRGETSPLQ